MRVVKRVAWMAVVINRLDETSADLRAVSTIVVRVASTAATTVDAMADRWVDSSVLVTAVSWAVTKEKWRAGSRVSLTATTSIDQSGDHLVDLTAGWWADKKDILGIGGQNAKIKAPTIWYASAARLTKVGKLQI